MCSKNLPAPSVSRGRCCWLSAETTKLPSPAERQAGESEKLLIGPAQDKDPFLNQSLEAGNQIKLTNKGPRGILIDKS